MRDAPELNVGNLEPAIEVNSGNIQSTTNVHLNFSDVFHANENKNLDSIQLNIERRRFLAVVKVSVLCIMM